MDNQGRLLAVDYGQKNIGLAVCDELRLTVQPLPSLVNQGKKDFLRRIREIVGKQEISGLVVGMPLGMDGSRGEAATAMDKIIRSLTGTLGLPVEAMDERLSSVEADEMWRAMTPRRRGRYRTADSLAAALILERFIKET